MLRALRGRESEAEGYDHDQEDRDGDQRSGSQSRMILVSGGKQCERDDRERQVGELVPIR
jgi:hypothetical protein